MATRQFPKRLYVYVDGDDWDDFICTVENESLIDEDGTRMAVYQLVSTGTVEVVRRYVEKTRAKR